MRLLLLLQPVCMNVSNKHLPRYAAAVLRCYIDAKVTKGRGKEAIEGKLDVLEREMAVASQVSSGTIPNALMPLACRCAVVG